MVKLRGVAWDHRRCWGPLDASVKPYSAAHPGIEIEWDRRSLYEFGEGALEPVLSTYDLVVFDHPFIGDIARGRLMVPFDDYLSGDQLGSFERDSVGSSWRSYAKDGHQWALPIDAACLCFDRVLTPMPAPPSRAPADARVGTSAKSRRGASAFDA